MLQQNPHLRAVQVPASSAHDFTDFAIGILSESQDVAKDDVWGTNLRFARVVWHCEFVEFEQSKQLDSMKAAAPSWRSLLDLLPKLQVVWVMRWPVDLEELGLPKNLSGRFRIRHFHDNRLVLLSEVCTSPQVLKV